MEGSSHANREAGVAMAPAYIGSADPGRYGGGTYTGQNTEPTIQDYENVFGPSARDIKQDLQRFKRHGRWHLPDVLKGPNQFLTDRVDGLITDATNSPFTTKILPYRYKEDPDGKMKWNVWSFDEGLASRVPYEAAARTLTQAKRSFSAYMVRQGMAINLEHNFMMTPQGRENFSRQLNQVIGSIQMTNDLDVHVALVLAPSYQKTMQERFYTNDKSPAQVCRQYVDLFGFMQKNVNALDILIEEAKAILRTWGSPMPDFLLCNSKLTFQLTMTPEKTNYVTQGYDGVKRLRQGPDLASYRGINIIHSRAFSMENGKQPRDILRRRVRVAEYYRIPPSPDNIKREFEFYNEARDTWFTLGFNDLLQMAKNETNRADIETLLHKSETDLTTPPIRQRVLAQFLGADLEEGSGSAEHAVEWQVSYPPHRDAGAGGVTEWCNLNVLDRTRVNFKTFSGSYIVSAYAPFEWRGCTLDRRELSEIGHHVMYYPSLTWTASERWSTALRASKSQLSMPDQVTGPIKDLRWYGPDGTTEYSFSFLLIFYKQLYMRYATSCRDLDFGEADDNDIRWVTTPRHSDGVVQNYSGYVYYPRVGMFGNPNHLLHFPALVEKNHYDEYTNLTPVDSWSQSLILAVEFIYAICRLCANEQELAMVIIQTTTKMTPGATYANAVEFSRAFYEAWEKTDFFVKHTPQLQSRTVPAPPMIEVLASHGIETLPTGLTTCSHPAANLVVGRLFTTETNLKNFRTFPCMSTWVLRNMSIDHSPWSVPPGSAPLSVGSALSGSGALELARALLRRIFGDAGWDPKENDFHTTEFYARACARLSDPKDELNLCREAPLEELTTVSGSAPPALDAYELSHDNPKSGNSIGGARHEDVEVVIVRPNIEHYMLGIILGLGGNDLGNTLWGQTELSVYDDSMHGVWGMSYKYHERAIVFNEKNLIRLWDVAYDGYIGGKDDTHVEWTKGDDCARFKHATMDVTENYRGQSMMVMAFLHSDKKKKQDHFKRNWPSPIVFYDDGRAAESNLLLPADQDNIHMIDAEEFRVFNNPLYTEKYGVYRNQMPNFKSLNAVRKNAGQSSVDMETPSEMLAFQGTMRIKTKGGMGFTEILGSGHHGPDYVGIASVRDGKGQKVAATQPTLHRLI